MTELSPDLQFHKSQLRLHSGEIRAIAEQNAESCRVDTYTPAQQRKLDQAARIVLDTFLAGGFFDPSIGKCIGSFVAFHIDDLLIRMTWAEEDFRELLHNLLQHYFYPKEIATSIAFEFDERRLTSDSLIERWYQETIDRANLLEFLSIEVGNTKSYPIDEYKQILMAVDRDNVFREIETVFGAIGAIACQDSRILQYLQPTSPLIKACGPYDEDIYVAKEILDQIKKQLFECTDETAREKRVSKVASKDLRLSEEVNALRNNLQTIVHSLYDLMTEMNANRPLVKDRSPIPSEFPGKSPSITELSETTQLLKARSESAVITEDEKRAWCSLSYLELNEVCLWSKREWGYPKFLDKVHECLNDFWTARDAIDECLENLSDDELKTLNDLRPSWRAQLTRLLDATEKPVYYTRTHSNRQDLREVIGVEQILQVMKQKIPDWSYEFQQIRKFGDDLRSLRRKETDDLNLLPPRTLNNDYIKAAELAEQTPDTPTYSSLQQMRSKSKGGIHYEDGSCGRDAAGRKWRKFGRFVYYYIPSLPPSDLNHE